MIKALLGGTADIVSINTKSLVSLSNQGLLASQSSLIDAIEETELTTERITSARAKASALGITL